MHLLTLSLSALLVLSLAPACVVTATASHNAVMPSYQQWLAQTGAWAGVPMEVREAGPSRLGVFATEDLAADTVFFAIPREQWVTGSMARASPELKPFSERIADDHVMVALWMMLEAQKSASTWAPWLDVLPQHLDCPFLWSDEELAELKGSHQLQHAAKQRAQLHSLYAQLDEAIFSEHREIFPAEHFTLDAFLHSYGNVITRVWGTASERIVSVPAVDMWNHHPQGAAADLSDGVWKLRLTHAIEKGQEVFLNYGNKINPELFSTYGFVLGEELDGLTDTLATSTKSTAVGTLLAPSLLKQFRSATAADQLVSPFRASAAGTFNSAALVFLRAVSMEFGEVSTESLTRLLDGKATSLANEATTLHKLAQILGQKMRAYPTTLEEDEALLAGGALPYRKEVAIRLRLGEKRTIVNLAQRVSNAWGQTLLENSIGTDETLQW